MDEPTSRGSGDDTPNAIVAFQNHFLGRDTCLSVPQQLDIAAALGYSGIEFHPIEPDDDDAWQELVDGIATTGLPITGMYVQCGGVVDDESDAVDWHIDRVVGIVRRMAALPSPYVSLTLCQAPQSSMTGFAPGGSAHAEPRHWERGRRIVAAVDSALRSHGVAGHLYNHADYLTDTPAANARLLELSGATTICPGFSCLHALLVPGLPEASALLGNPALAGLGYVALHNAVSGAGGWTMTSLGSGEIDIAALLGELWRRGYTGPIISQGYGLEGEPAATAGEAIRYIRDARASWLDNRGS